MCVLVTDEQGRPHRVPPAGELHYTYLVSSLCSPVFLVLNAAASLQAGKKGKEKKLVEEISSAVITMYEYHLICHFKKPWKDMNQFNMIRGLPVGLLWLDGDRAGDACLLVSSDAGGGTSAVFWREQSEMIHTTLAKRQIQLKM